MAFSLSFAKDVNFPIVNASVSLWCSDPCVCGHDLRFGLAMHEFLCFAGMLINLCSSKFWVDLNMIPIVPSCEFAK